MAMREKRVSRVCVVILSAPGEVKVCTKCDETKPLSEFSKRGKGRGGYNSRCKACRLEYYRAYRVANRARFNATSTRYYKAHRAEVAARKRVQRTENPEKCASQALQTKYGITLADYDEMLETQGGGCAICGNTPVENGRRLCVDHDHETGEVRGLLCDACNRGLGYFRDDSEICRQAMLYLRGHGK